MSSSPGLLARTLAYLWRGWRAVFGLLIFLALWDWGSRLYGELILPSPWLTFSTLAGLLEAGEGWSELAATARRALAGFGLALFAGSLLGLLAGLSVTATLMSRPVITLLLGTPPIAWLVLAVLWFGVGDATPIFTVFIVTFPIVFIAAVQGAHTLDGQLRDLARAYRLPRVMTLTDIYLPHVVSYLFPSWVVALAMSWKVVVMAELLATSNGVGAALAVSRSHLDTAAAMAWIAAVVGLLLLVEYLFLEPLKRKLESWRTA
jgi:NitT/TauT family transport system permease protein